MKGEDSMRVFMSIRRKHFAVASLASLLILGGCWQAENLDVDASQCWNPKLLRAKVGSAIFDLPPGIEFRTHGEKTPPGILTISSKSRSSNPAYRAYCQNKNNVPCDFSGHVRYVLKPSYGRPLPLLGEIRPYNPSAEDKRFSYYIADVKDVGKIKYLRSTSTFRGKRETERLLVFGFNGREADLPCQVWGDRTPSGDAWLEGTTFAYSCAGGIPLRMDDIIITVADPNTLFNPDTKKPRKPPPELWPIQWRDAIQKITSYRIDKAGKASQ